MFMIQMKKAVHKPFEAPYFVSPDYRVASWFYYHAPILQQPASMSLVKVSKDFVIETVEPDVMFKNQDISPNFHVAPLRVYGLHEAFKLPDGTTYFNWFEPVKWALSDLTFEELESSGTNAIARIPMNLWHYHHIFKTWNSIPEKG